MGGTKEAENIDNLQALCRSCHVKYGDKKEYKEFLKDIHYDYKYGRITKERIKYSI